jgi:hypothetical protein
MPSIYSSGAMFGELIKVTDDFVTKQLTYAYAIGETIQGGMRQLSW